MLPGDPTPIHVGGMLTTAAVVLAGIGSLAVVAMAVVALVRRRSLSYGLVALALVAFLLHVLVGMPGVRGAIPVDHHTVEHALDAVAVTLLLLAVYFARTADPGGEETYE